MRTKYLFTFCMILFGSISIVSCSLFEKEEDDDMVPDQILTNDYVGNLTLNLTGIYPEFDVSTQMDVDIDAATGLVTISSGDISYEGETMTSNESKIKRSGSWTINPTARIEEHDGERYIQVDAGVVVQNDVTEVWALVNGNWQLMQSVDGSSTPNSDLSFKMFEAVSTGAVNEAETNAGSMTWTLRLTVVP